MRHYEVFLAVMLLSLPVLAADHAVPARVNNHPAAKTMQFGNGGVRERIDAAPQSDDFVLLKESGKVDARHSDRLEFAWSHDAVLADMAHRVFDWFRLRHCSIMTLFVSNRWQNATR